MFSKLMKVQLLNITDNKKTDSTLLIQIMLITIGLQYHASDISRAWWLTENNILWLT